MGVIGALNELNVPLFAAKVGMNLCRGGDLMGNEVVLFFQSGSARSTVLSFELRFRLWAEK
jgi:hypothetical protein